MHGIMFDDVHSWRDLNLIPSDLYIPPASPKTVYVNIPGADGSLDLTEATGEVKYSDRDCKFTFTVWPSAAMSWEDKKTQISNLLNGRTVRITLDKDPDYYYQGRCAVNGWESNKNIHSLVINAKVNPWKFKQAETAVSFALNSTARPVTLTNGKRAVCPTIETTEAAVIVFGGSTFNLGAGTHKVLDIRLLQGANEVSISGSGTITFRYQEADL